MAKKKHKAPRNEANGHKNSDTSGGSSWPHPESDPLQANDSGDTYGAREPLTFEKVWLMLEESRKESQEAFRQFREHIREQTREFFRESREQLQKSSEEADRRMQESARQWEETKREMKESSEQVDRKLEKTAQLIDELREEYKNRWGELVESLVSGNLLRLLKARNIPVGKIRQRVRNYKGEPNYELDIVASNGDEVVIVEVKSVLNAWAVKHFISQLELVRNSSRRFRQQRMIGAVAFLKDHSDAATMAISRGLLVIRATGDSAVILNEKDVEPTRF